MPHCNILQELALELEIPGFAFLSGIYPQKGKCGPERLAFSGPDHIPALLLRTNGVPYPLLL